MTTRTQSPSPIRTLLLTLTCCLVVGWSVTPATAQTGTRVGLGIGLSNASLGASDLSFVETILSPTSIYVPITFAGFRLEPEIGYFRLSADNGEAESTTSLFQLGTGVFAIQSAGDNLLYFGGRVGITRQSTSFDFSGDFPGGNEESSVTNFFVGPAVGAEHFFGDRFSLGGEAQVIYTSLGDDDEGDDSSASLLRTRGIFFVRWHL